MEDNLGLAAGIALSRPIARGSPQAEQTGSATAVSGSRSRHNLDNEPTWIAVEIVGRASAIYPIVYIIYIMDQSKQPEPRRATTGTRVKSMRHKAILAERFRHARRACWLTVPRAAKLLHVSVRTVHNWGAGIVAACSPRRGPALALARMLQPGVNLGLLQKAGVPIRLRQ
ncbi:hypothetical protein [Denitratimonas tolerans]|uniref:Helix-turn-helix domain-containing protein n=1 Tax=Denitratimonas tolerans TaxID=1338420 RepID=A0AAW9R2Q1_9GAMM